MIRRMRLSGLLSRLNLSKSIRWVLFLFCFVALFANFIANERPLLCKLQGKWMSPALADMFDWTGGGDIEKDWHGLSYDFVIRAPIPYSANYIDLDNANFVSPFGKQEIPGGFYRHWLGTDGIGHDVLAGLIYGTRIALLIGIVSSLIALLLGIPYGLTIGYFGNSGLRLSWLQLLLYVIVLMISFAFVILWLQLLPHQPLMSWASLLVAILLPVLAQWMDGKFLSKGNESKKINIPIDQLGMRLIEIMKSIPGLFLLLACLSLMVQPTIIFISLIIGIIRWPTIARYVRGEVIRVKNLGYIQSATSLGLPTHQILYRHLLPNALGPVVITIAFGMSAAVLLESGLSFLGLGLSVEQMSWGKLLFQARSKFDAWWLVVFPGFMIFLMVFTFNRLGERFRLILNPRLRDTERAI